MRAAKNSTHVIDTNVLIYAFDAHDEKKNSVAKQIVKGAFNGDRKLIVTNQILAEFVSAATTKLSPKLTTDEITRFLRSIMSSQSWFILDYTAEDVVATAEMEKHFWDSLIAATIKKTKVPLLTENTKHFKHTAAEALNPF